MDFFYSDDSLSELSFDDDDQNRVSVKEYLSTNLITSREITLADVISETVTMEMIQQRETLLINRCKFQWCDHGIVDPRKTLKEQSKHGIVDTMVPY